MTSRLRLRRCRVARALRRRTSGWGTFLTVSVAIVVYPNWYQNGSIERIPRAIGPRQSKGLRSRVLLPAVSSAGLARAIESWGRSRRGRRGPPSEVLALVRALVLGAQALELLGVEAHAEREAHLAEDRLDLVERLLAEVLRLQELGLGLLHEIGDGPNVGGLQTVRGADGELELVHVAEEVLVQLGPRPRLVALGRLLLRRRLGEGREQREVVIEDPWRLADGRGRRDAAVGPHLEDEPFSPGRHGLDVEVHALDRREVGVQQDRVDRQGLGLTLLGGHVAAAALDAHLHLEHPVLVEGGERHVGREDLDVGVLLEVARLDHARALRAEPEDLRTVDVVREDHLSEVQHDVERVLRDPREMRELVEHVLDLHPRRRRAVDGRQEGAAVGDAHGQRESWLEGLDDQLAVILFLNGPVVTRGKLKLHHEDPLRGDPVVWRNAGLAPGHSVYQRFNVTLVESWGCALFRAL